jgi:D-beta-D-heptose 7-phosphate kinase/D-beta-D-heptose 1-phosphate adenosyltransferase
VKQARLELGRLEKLLEVFERLRLLVVGDVFLDEYLLGDAHRISPEAPVPVVRVQSESTVVGGAGNVVRNVVALSAGCRFCSVVGDDAAGGRVRTLLQELGVDGTGLVVAEGRPTSRKTRVVARRQQIVRLDRETIDPLPEPVLRRLGEAAEAALPAVQGLVFADYAKGVLSPGLVHRLMGSALTAGVPVYVDPKRELDAYRGATLLKPNVSEAEGLAGFASEGASGLERVARRLQERLAGGDVVITQGGAGMMIFEGTRPAFAVATQTQQVFDVQGAGDTSIAALALSLSAGASLREAAVIANAAAGVVVAKTGTATATREEVRQGLPAALAATEEPA